MGGYFIRYPGTSYPEQYIQRRRLLENIDYFNQAKNQKGVGYYDNPENSSEGITKEQWVAHDPFLFSGDYTETWLTQQLSNVEIQNYKLGRTVDWRDQCLSSGLR